MKERQYALLLSTTTALHTNSLFLKAQIAEFTTRCNSRCSEIANMLNSTCVNLDTMPETSTLAAGQLLQLSRIRQHLGQTNAELTKQLEKQASAYIKDILAIEQRIAKKIVPSLAEPNTFDIAKIQTMLDQIKQSLSSSKHSLDACIMVIKKHQTTISELNARVRRLDMPNFIAQTTRHVEQAAQELALINAQVLTSDSTGYRLKQEFLPLREALQRLRLQEETACEAAPKRSHSPAVV